MRRETARRAARGRGTALLAAAGRGAVAGLVGAVVMTAGERVEQAVTHRPDSYVPARALRAVLARPTGDGEQPAAWNQAMHLGTGMLVGALRGVWSAVGIRGPRATAAHAVVRLAFDQTVENATGVGAPPHAWPVSEQAVDFLHKGVYALVTGLVADWLVAPALQSARGLSSH